MSGERFGAFQRQFVVSFLATLINPGVLCQLAFSQTASPSQFALPGHPTPISMVKTPRQIAEEAFPSVALLVMHDGRGQPISLGSGFVLREGLVVTNRHVIAGASGGYCKLVGKSAQYEITGTAAVDDAHDLAILAVQGLKAPPLAIGDSDQAAVGDEVYAVGNPQGLEGTFSQGIVSAIRRVGSSTILQITAPISPGSSGGPILDTSGKTIGIAVGMFSGGQNLNLAIPSSYLTTLVGSVTSEVHPISRQTGKPGKPFLTDGLGEEGIKGVVGENFTWFSGSRFSAAASFSFSLRNQLNEPVKWLHCLVVFFDATGRPLDAKEVWSSDVIAGGLAKRVTGEVDESVRELSRRTEIRMLNFRLAE
jgi:S1-C subfamily serine protease